MPPEIDPSVLDQADRRWSERFLRLLKNPVLAGLASFLNKPFPGGMEIRIDVLGNKMTARSWDRALALLLWKWSRAEAAEREALRANSRKGMVAVDIGANIGLHTLELSRLAGPGGKVYALEPDPRNFELLLRNVESNGCGNVVCLRKAAADKTGQRTLFLNPYNSGDNRLFGSWKGQEAVCVDSVALDDLLADEKRVDLIKMDIQGAEYRALLGMEKTLKRSPGACLVSEISPHLLESMGDSAESFMSKAAELRLDCSILTQDGGQARRLTAAEIIELLRLHKKAEIGLLLRSKE